MAVCSLMESHVFFQEHLGHIGPEEFVQAFVQKDPLDTTQVKPSLAATTHLQTRSMNLVHPNVCLINDLRELWSEGKHLQKEKVSSIKKLNIYISCKKALARDMSLSWGFFHPIK